MRKIYGTTALLFLIWSGLTSYAVAHSPYFGQSESISHPDFGKVTFVVLYGDGIFFGDPSQVVVYDGDGYLLAASPQSDALRIRCDRSKAAQICLVYDEVLGIVLEPDYERWEKGRIIVEEGHPPRDAYPEYMNIEYGFSQRPATVVEKVSFEVAGIFCAPATTFLSVLWWGVAWSFVARLFWRWRLNGWRVFPIKMLEVVWVILSIFSFIGMTVLTLYFWIFDPYSMYFLLFVILVGLLIAVVLTRPKTAAKN